MLHNYVDSIFIFSSIQQPLCNSIQKMDYHSQDPGALNRNGNPAEIINTQPRYLLVDEMTK
jgi:hypothetical protein